MSFAPEIEPKTVVEIRNGAVSFLGKLDVGELLTGTPTITGSSDLTLSNKVVSTSGLTIRGTTHAAGQAVTFTVAGGLAGETYDINVNVGTNAANAQTLVRDVRVEVTT